MADHSGRFFSLDKQLWYGSPDLHRPLESGFETSLMHSVSGRPAALPHTKHRTTGLLPAFEPSVFAKHLQHCMMVPRFPQLLLVVELHRTNCRSTFKHCSHQHVNSARSQTRKNHNQLHGTYSVAQEKRHTYKRAMTPTCGGLGNTNAIPEDFHLFWHTRDEKSHPIRTLDCH